MTDDKDNVYISIHPKHMQKKNYEPAVSVLVRQLGYMEGERRVFSRSELIAKMKQVLHLSKYKCGIIIDVFLETGLFTQGKIKDELYSEKITAPFLKMLVTTARFGVESLSTFGFKVYCYLFNKYNIHIYYGHDENYFFSESEILREIGYSRGTAVLRRLKENLLILKELNLIDYNEKPVGRPGHHGTYHELYEVNEYSNVQKKALTQMIEEKETITDTMSVEAKIMGISNNLIESAIIEEKEESQKKLNKPYNERTEEDEKEILKQFLF